MFRTKFGCLFYFKIKNKVKTIFNDDLYIYIYKNNNNIYILHNHILIGLFGFSSVMPIIKEQKYIKKKECKKST